MFRRFLTLSFFGNLTTVPLLFVIKYNDAALINAEYSISKRLILISSENGRHVFTQGSEPMSELKLVSYCFLDSTVIGLCFNPSFSLSKYFFANYLKWTKSIKETTYFGHNDEVFIDNKKSLNASHYKQIAESTFKRLRSMVYDANNL